MLTDWQAIYESKLTDPAGAAKLIQPGDTVAIPIFPPLTIPPAIFARKDELKGVTIRLLAPASDPGWLQPGMEEHFKVEFETYVGDFGRPVMDDRRGDFLPSMFSMGFKNYDERPGEGSEADVVVVTVSKPNEQGFVHFGPHNWTKRSYVRRVRTAIAEVDESMMPVFGDVYAHVSEFDAFVPFTPPSLDLEGFKAVVEGTGKEDEYVALYEHASPTFWGTVAGVIRAVSPVDIARLLGVGDPPEEAKGIAENLKYLVRDRDTIQIGTGEPGRNMPNLGVFDEREDLGLHTELGSPGYGRLVREGIITNKYKTLHPGKSVAAAWTGVAEEDLRYIADNPLFELYDPGYVLHMRTIMQLDNFLAINNGISIDFLGHINSESVFGPRLINGLGGQPDAHIGAMYAKGGRAVTLLPSTALEGSVSRIVPMMPEGSYCTIPRFYADYVVTEYGIARLFGKTHRQRGEELISVAHPDHRADLRAALQSQLYP